MRSTPGTSSICGEFVKIASSFSDNTVDGNLQLNNGSADP